MPLIELDNIPWQLHLPEELLITLHQPFNILKLKPHLFLPRIDKLIPLPGQRKILPLTACHLSLTSSVSISDDPFNSFMRITMKKRSSWFLIIAHSAHANSTPMQCGHARLFAQPPLSSGNRSLEASGGFPPWGQFRCSRPGSISAMRGKAEKADKKPETDRCQRPGCLRRVVHVLPPPLLGAECS